MWYSISYDPFTFFSNNFNLEFIYLIQFFQKLSMFTPDGRDKYIIV